MLTAARAAAARLALLAAAAQVAAAVARRHELTYSTRNVEVHIERKRASSPARAALESQPTLREGCELAVLSLAARSAWSSEAAGELRFARVAASKRDAVIVPDGYRADVVLRWGDPLVADAPRLDAARVAAGSLLEPSAAADTGAAIRLQLRRSRNIRGRRPHSALRQPRVPVSGALFPGWAEARARARSPSS